MDDKNLNPGTPVTPVIDTPEYAAEISKETTDEIAAVAAETAADLAKATSDDEKARVVSRAEAKKAAVAAKAAQKTAAKSEPTSKSVEKINGLRISVSGTYVKDKTPESYVFEDIVLPYCNNVMSYLKQAVMLRFKQDGRRVLPEDIIEYFIDDDEEIVMDATFLGKDIFEFTEYEVLCAKIYYKLKQVVIDQGLRQARVSLYKACCRTMGRPVPDDTDTQIKTWPKFKLAK